MHSQTTLILLLSLFVGGSAIKCYSGQRKKMIECASSFCVNAAYFTTDESFYLRDCEDKLLGKMLNQGLIDEDGYLNNTCMTILVQGYNTGRVIMNVDYPYNNTDLTMYRRCCFSDGCNMKYPVFNAVDMKSVIRKELENNNKDVESDEYKAKLDSHHQSADDIQTLICISILIFFTVWSFIFGYKYKKTTCYLMENANRRIDEELLQSHPIFANRINSHRKVDGKLSLHQLIDFLCFLDSRNTDNWQGAARDNGDNTGSSKEPMTKEEKKKNDAKKRKDAADLRKKMESPNDPNDPDIRRKFTYREITYEAVGDRHACPIIDRINCPKYEDLLYRLIEHGPYQYNFKPLDLIELLDQAKDIFAAEPSFLHFQPPLVIIGDIRGQYQDLHRWLGIVGYPPRTKLLFMGGILDNNELGSVECIAFIAALKIKFPSDVFVIRGATEVVPFKIYNNRFKSEKYKTSIEHTIMRMCSQLPIAAKLGKKVLIVHSGITHKLCDLTCINHITRPFFDFDIQDLEKQIIFSTPAAGIKMYRHEGGNRVQCFGTRAIEQLIRSQHIELIVRASNPSKDGIMWHSKGMMATIWSAVNKQTDCGGYTGVALEFDTKNNCTVHKMIAAFDRIDPDDEVTAPSMMDTSEKATKKEKSLRSVKSPNGIDKNVPPAGLVEGPSRNLGDTKK